MKPQEPAGHVCQIRKAIRSSAEDQPHVVPVEGCPGREFLKDSTKVADADSHQFRHVDATRLVRAFRRVLRGETRHGIAEPQVPGFGIVRAHTHALLGSSVELVKKMGVNANPGSYDEITHAGLPFKIGKKYAAKRDSPGHRV